MSSDLSTKHFKAPQTTEAWADLFFDACKSGDLELVKQLCSSEFKIIFDIHASYYEEGFQWACEKGHLEIVKFLTTSKDLLEAEHSLINIHSHGEEGFQLACINGHFDVVKFLTTSPELLAVGHTFVDLHADDEAGFQWACQFGHLEIIKFLTTSPELLAAGHTFADIHAFNEQGFQLACENDHWNVVQFLIFDLKFERTPTINAIVKNYPQAQEFFRIREEQEQIRKSLIESQLTLTNSTSLAQEVKSNSSLRI